MEAQPWGADHSALAEVADNLESILAELADPDSELTASAATKRRIEGVILAFRTVI